MDPRKFATARASLWARVRLQLGGGLFLAVLLPWLVRIQLERQQLALYGLQASLIGSLIATIAGYYGFRMLSRYPGVRASFYILPCFSVSYGATLAVFFFARLDYSRLHFATSYAICLLWYFAVYAMLQRQHRPRIGVVPFGMIEGITAIDAVDWVLLTHPDDIRPESVVVADLRADIPPDWERYLTACALAGTLVMHVKQVEESLTGRVSIEHLSENNLGSLIPGIIFGKFKRAADFVIALVALPMLAPLLVLVAILIKLDSPGPVIFRQRRIGFRGAGFEMYKFRSMTHRREVSDWRTEAMTRDEDARVTRVGRVIRLYRIDELPQIFNILRGQMSWIGPRPEATALSDWYERELPFYRYRHIVRPGITGWAQVKQGHVAEVDEVLGKLHYDFYYIKNFSFWLDMLIVAGTIKTIVSGFGAR